MFEINKIKFEITELDGEFFYKAQQGQLHPQTLKKVIRDLDIIDSDIRVYDAKMGVFSVIGEDEALKAQVRACVAKRADELWQEIFGDVA